MNQIIEMLVIAIVGGAVYGLIKTLLEMAFPEFFGLDPDWYKDTKESPETDSESESEWDIEVENKAE